MSLVLIIFIVLPHLAVCSRLVGTGIFISLSHGIYNSICVLCVHQHCSFLFSPSEKVRLIWKTSLSLVEHIFQPSIVSNFGDDSVSVSPKQRTLFGQLLALQIPPSPQVQMFSNLTGSHLESIQQVVNEHFCSDIHSLSPLSPECLECGEINIYIASMVALYACVSVKSVCTIARQGFTHPIWKSKTHYGQIPTQSTSKYLLKTKICIQLVRRGFRLSP